MYYVYMLRCEDNSLYTGITTNLERRMKEHFTKSEKCSKYTMRHEAKKLETVWQAENRALASKLEYYIKTLSKVQKESLIENSEKLKEFLKDKIKYEMYINIKDKIKNIGDK